MTPEWVERLRRCAAGGRSASHAETRDLLALVDELRAERDQLREGRREDGHTMNHLRSEMFAAQDERDAAVKLGASDREWMEAFKKDAADMLRRAEAAEALLEEARRALREIAVGKTKSDLLHPLGAGWSMAGRFVEIAKAALSSREKP